MIFKQYENGSCDIIFSNEETKIIQERQVIHLSDEALRHFGNHMIKIIMDWNIKFNPDVQKLHTKVDTEVKTYI
jgi:hypothetical protein